MAVITGEFMHKKSKFVFLNEWRLAVSEFGTLTREFYIAEIETLESYSGKRVWRFMEGRYTKVLL